MSMKSKGTVIAAAAAMAFASGALVAPAAYAGDAMVKCVGANACKGHSDCKTAKNECKGMNSCKGQGWVSKKDGKECEAAGGKVDMMKK